jgi:hypothetical protein
MRRVESEEDENLCRRGETRFGKDDMPQSKEKGVFRVSCANQIHHCTAAVAAPGRGEVTQQP